MGVVNESGFAVAWSAGNVPPHRRSATLVLKGMFRLVAGAPAVRADDQELPIGDVPESEEPGSATRYPSDFVPFKPAAEAMAVGSAWVPGGKKSTAIQAGFGVGSWFKAVAVVGDRRKGPSDIRSAWMSEPEPFRSIPVSYGRAWGGSGFAANPAGSGVADVAGPGGIRYRPMPNILPLDRAGADPEQTAQPAGLGPQPLPLAGRRYRSGSCGDRYLKLEWPGYPSDFDWSELMGAPADQRFPLYFKGDEEIRLENLHPEHAKFSGRLPGLRPRWFVKVAEGKSEKIREVELKLDTIWIDAESLRVALVWRGVTAAATEALKELKDHVVVVEPLSAPARPASDYASKFPPPPAPPPPPPEKPAPPVAPDVVWVSLSSELAARFKELQASDPALAKQVGPPPAYRRPTAKEWTRPAVEAATDLTEADLRGLDLSGANLEGKVLAHAKLKGARLTGAKLAGANLVAAELGGADLEGADLSKADLSWADLEGANLAGAKLDGAEGSRAVLRGARLEKATLLGALLPEADLRGAKAAGADFSSADLTGALLEKADCTRAKFASTVLRQAKAPGLKADHADMTAVQASHGADFTGASLREIVAPRSTWSESILDGAQLTRANLHGSMMMGTSLRNAVLAYAHLRESRLEGARLDGVNGVSANLLGVNAAGASLVGAQFPSSNVYNADFDKADMSGANFQRALTTGARLA